MELERTIWLKLRVESHKIQRILLFLSVMHLGKIYKYVRLLELVHNVYNSVLVLTDQTPTWDVMPNASTES